VVDSWQKRSRQSADRTGLVWPRISWCLITADAACRAPMSICICHVLARIRRRTLVNCARRVCRDAGDPAVAGPGVE